MNNQGESSRISEMEESMDCPKSKKLRLLNQDQVEQLNTNRNTSVFYENREENNSNDMNNSNRNLFNDPHNYHYIESFVQDCEEIFDNNERNHDKYLLKWHTSQMARCHFENRINMGIEEFLLIRSASDDSDNETIEVKDEGILMAIESHGLKTNNNLDRESLSNPIETDESMCFSETNFKCLEPISYNNQVDDFDVEKVYEVNSNDFLNKAVSAAISEKGLSHSTE